MDQSANQRGPTRVRDSFAALTSGPPGVAPSRAGKTGSTARRERWQAGRIDRLPQQDPIHDVFDFNMAAVARDNIPSASSSNKKAES